MLPPFSPFDTVSSTSGDPFGQTKTVSLEEFLVMWLAEQRAQQLHDFMSVQFAAGAELVERSSALSFRYCIRRQPPVTAVLSPPSESGSPRSPQGGGARTDSTTDRSSIAPLFRKFEAHKDRLHVQEYSLGQTSLEQIFNQLATATYSDTSS
jgi:hypothetical protein